VAAWRRALADLEGARAAARRLTDAAGEKTERSRAEHEHFVERLRVAAAAAWVREVELELATAPLPDGVELLELTGWSRAGAAVDGVLEVAPDAIAPTLAALPAILRGARALRLLRRAHHAVEVACDALDREIAAAELGFTRRLSSIAKLQIAEPAAFVTAQLDRVRPQVIASMGAVIEHASVHLGSELAELGASWTRAVAAATTNHELGAAVTAIEEGTVASGQRIADEVRILATGGLGGLVHDMTPIVLAPLTAHGLTEAELRPRTTAALPHVAILASLTQMTPGGLATGRLSAMFRSTETVKHDVLDKLADRASRMRNKASAEMLDAEPILRAAVETALTTTLQHAIEAVTNRLDDQLAAARTDIATARTALAPKVAARDAGRTHAKALAAAIAALEANAPAAEAAAAAV
jgi:hypothetical protein